jgi:sec-independent protein translocase protein TatC
MPLMDHLGELRRRLVIVLASLFITALVLYFATPTIIVFLLEPIKEFMPSSSLALLGDSSSTGMIVTSPLGGFSIRFRVAIFMSFVVCSPIVLWEILAFFLPALKPNERRWVVPTLAVGICLFVIGIVFCYKVILGAAFGWMMGESDAIGTTLPDAETYLKAIMGLLIAFGIAFELPLIVFYLVVFNLVPYKTFRKNWRTIYVVLLVFCAMVTPDASPVTMGFMFAALLSMYELSLLFSRIVLARRIAKQKAEGTYIEPDDDDDEDDDDEEDDDDGSSDDSEEDDDEEEERPSTARRRFQR